MIFKLNYTADLRYAKFYSQVNTNIIVRNKSKSVVGQTKILGLCKTINYLYLGTFYSSAIYEKTNKQLLLQHFFCSYFTDLVLKLNLMSSE